ncbi:hypothetical protein UPYG_G00129580 [Umbra pygmaea]|uniref:Microtubule-associated tumor suppressor candidate 2-like n=1 Tax=Umbra pygmaea TaxID=75934 RepID=A0ABD0X6R6_UMBPY
MSVSTGLQSQCVSGRAIKNDNSKSQLHLPSTGDANANKLALTRKDEGQTGEVIGNTIDDHASNPLPPLVARREAQDKLMIWGMAEQCVDPDLQGFEGNEEKEEEEEYGGEDSKGGGDEGLMSISSSSTASSVSVSVHRNDNERNNTEREMEQDIGAEREGTGRMEKIRENEKGVLLHSSDDHDCGALRSERGKERRGEQSERGERGSLEEARSLSENNVFDASLSVSAMSFLCSRLDDALDASGHPQTTASLSCAPDPNTNPDPKSNYNPNAKSYITTSAIIPGQCKKRAPSVDQNRNSTASKSQETPDLELHQYQRSPDQNVHHLNPDASSKVNELLCDQSVTHEQRTNHNVFTQRHNVRCFQANKSQQCSDGRMGLRMTEGEKERVPLPRRQQLVRPLCQSEPGKGNSLAEPIARWQTYPSQCTDADSKDTGHGGVSNRHTQDTLEINNAKVNSQFRLHTSYQPSSSPGPHQSSPASCPAQRETRPLGKQGNCAGQTSSPSSPSSSLERRRQYEAQSQFTYRRSTCFSPNQRATEPHCPSQVSPPSPLSTPQGSPRRQLQQPMSPSRIITGAARYPHGTGSSGLKPPLRSMIMSGIPKPRIQHHKVPNSPPTCPPKPKGVRPKIITYIRKGPQLKPQASDGPYQVSSLPSRLSAYTHSPSTNTPHTHPSGPNTQPCGAPESKSGAVLSASNLLYDKYRQEMQRKRLLHPGLMGTGLCPPGHTHTVPPTHTHSSSHTHTHAGPNNHTHSYTAPPKLGSKTESFYGQMVEKYLPTEKGRSKGNLGREDPSGSRTASQATQGDGSGILLHTGTELRPQLGLGAVARANPRCVTTTKTKMIGQGQRAALGFSQPVQSVSPATNRNGQENTGDQLRPSTHPAPSPASTHTSRTLLHKSGLTGLRAPGFTSVRLPPGAPGAAASQTSAHVLVYVMTKGPTPPLQTPTLGGRPPHYRSRSLQPPSTPALPRRYLPAQPSGSPVGVRKESQRSSEITRSLPSSPKRLAVVPPKPQSPVFSRQRPAAGSFPPVSPRRVQRLQSRCDNQEEQLTTLRQELKTATLGTTSLHHHYPALLCTE